MTDQIGDGLRALRSSGLALMLCAALGSAANAQTKAVEVPAGALEEALIALANQTGQQLLYTPDLVAGRRTDGVSGTMTPEAALARLVGDAPLAIVRVGPNTLVLKRRPGPSDPGKPTLPLAGEPAPDQRLVIAHAPQGAPTLVDEVRVTGSNIRGAKGPSPLIVMDSADLQRSGYATVADALQTLAQTFGGESTEGTILTRADRTGSNSGYATGVNLRGLGSDATLVLVNGRRLAGSGNKGDFSDLSGIPTIAVSRVEVLLDGASAIYGSDAVGGVVNVILKRDFAGAEVRGRVGSGAGGEPGERQLSAILGQRWRGGGGFLAYEAHQRDRLPISERDFASDADLRSRGGSDRREPRSFPGNILGVDPTTGATRPMWAIPAGQPGVGLSPADFVAGAVNLSSPQAGLDLLPQQRRQTVYGAVHQSLTPDFELSAEARYSHRRTKVHGLAQTSTLRVTTANPYFVSPIGATSHQIDYAFQGELPNSQVAPVSQSFSGAAGFKLQLPGGWLLDGYGGLGRERIVSRTTGLLNSAFLNEALGSAADNPLTPYSPAKDGYFNPFTGQAVNTSAVLAFIGSGRAETRLRNQVVSGGLQADGPLLRLPAGELKLAVGVQARGESYRRSGVNFTSTVVPTAQQALVAERQMAAAYAELSAPLVGPENRRPALERLELTAAVRAERYSDFGSTVNPKIGLIWSPLDGVRWKATYGKSFRAPALTELAEAEVYTPLRLQDVSGQVLTLALNGGNPDLEPETAKSWTVSLELSPPQIPNLQFTLTGFRTTFEARIDRPLFSNRLTALTDPTLAGFVQRIDPQNPGDLELITRLLADPRTLTSLGVFPPTEYRAITDFRYVNTGRLRVSGLDVQASYGLTAFGGRLTFGANGAWLFDYKQQVTPLSPAVEFAGLAGYPAKFRARVSAEWIRGEVALGGALSHAAGFSDALGAKIDAQTKVDAHLRVTAPNVGGLAGVSASLVVRNLFDQDPPFYDNLTGIGFDPASGDPVGRFVALELAKRW